MWHRSKTVYVGLEAKGARVHGLLRKERHLLRQTRSRQPRWYGSIVTEQQSVYKPHTIKLQLWKRVTGIVTDAPALQTPQSGVGGRGFIPENERLVVVVVVVVVLVLVPVGLMTRGLQIPNLLEINPGNTKNEIACRDGVDYF